MLFPLLGLQLSVKCLGCLSCQVPEIQNSNAASCLGKKGDTYNSISRCRVQRYPKGERIALMGAEGKDSWKTSQGGQI